MIVDSTGNHYKTYFKNDYCAQVRIDALHGDEEDTVGYSIMLKNAYPIQVSQVELGEGAEGMLEVTVTWEYDNWKPSEEQNKKQSSISSWLPPLHGAAGGPEQQVQTSSFGPAGRGFI